MEKTEIYHLFHPRNLAYKDNRYEDFKAFWATSFPIFSVKFTSYLLWIEYRQSRPDGYGYSQFFDKFKKWQSSLSVGMHVEQVYRDKLYNLIFPKSPSL